MLSKVKVREILGNSTLTGEEVKVLLSEMYTLGEMFFEETLSSSGSKSSTWVIDTKGKNNEH